MKHGYVLLAICFLCSGYSRAEGQPAPVAPIPAEPSGERLAEPLADPTKAVKQPAAAKSGHEDLQDPTLMNENFRAALQRSGHAKAVPESGAAAPVPALPDITLVASVCGRHNEKAAAMLRIDGKTEIVHAGDKLTRIDKNQLIEIHILELHRRFVKIKVFPSNETLILR